MDMRNEFHQWLYEEVAVLKEGRVFLVKNRQNGMLAVKKLIPASLRPIYEAVSGMKSPALPRILSVQESGDTIWVLEEYVSGRSLRGILEVGRTLDDKETMALAKDLCEALECLHGAEPPIIHRDIKPDNIILSDLGRYVLSILTRRGSIPPLQGRTRFSLERRAMHRPSSTGSANPICGRTSMHWALLCTKRIPGIHMKKWSGAEGSCGLLSISVQILT